MSTPWDARTYDFSSTPHQAWRRRPHCSFVAHAGLVAALPLSLSARPKRKSDRRYNEARRGWWFVKAERIDLTPAADRTVSPGVKQWGRGRITLPDGAGRQP